MSYIKELKYIIYTSTIYVNYVFSPILALTGRKHEIDSGDNSWALTVGMAFIISMFLALKSIMEKNKLKYGINLIIFPLLFFLVAFMFENTFFPYTGTNGYPISKWFIFSALYVWPAVFIAIDVATEDSLDKIYKWLDILAVLISLAMIPSLQTLGLDGRISMGGDNYQAVAYMGAFAVGIIVYGIVSPYQSLRFSFFRKKAFKVISIVLILIDVVTIFISGGRGGVLLLILNVGICLFAFITNKRAVIKKIIIGTFAIVVFLFILGKVISAYGLTDFFEIGMERTFSYISGGSIDMSETSDRDIVYKRALENINNYPFIGQGVFRTMSMNGGYPHNFFLEILVNGGVFYLIYWLFYLRLFMKGLFRKIKIYPSKRYLLILTTLPVLSLLFSGTYTSNAYLWFVIAYIFIDLKITSKCA